MKKETVVSWQFKHIFEGAHIVSARINSQTHNPKLKKAHLEKITMRLVRGHVPDYPDKRLLLVSVYWYPTEGHQQGASWGYTLAETLKNAGAMNKGCIMKDSFSVYWELKKGESFTDGAMRIAKLLFKMLEIKLEESVPLMSDERLISLFVIYEIAWVGNNGPRLDCYMRKKHKLPEAPTLLHIQVF